MTEFTIKLSEYKIQVQAMFESTNVFFRDYLCDEAPHFSITITPADIVFERQKSAQEDVLEGIPVRNFSDAYLETIAVQRKIAEELFDYDTLLFHGSVVAVDGAAYLFTAKSGTGKSTHTRLWRELLGQRAVMVNDDKPFLGLAGEGVTVYGTPWNGKHNLGTNIAVPLKAICILERGETNEITPISPKEAVFMLLQQSNRPQNPRKMGKYLELLDKLSARVSFYRLKCNMEPEAAQLAYTTMSAPQ